MPNLAHCIKKEKWLREEEKDEEKRFQLFYANFPHQEV